MRASLTSAMQSVPRARAGATRVSQFASPCPDFAIPCSLTTDTRSLRLRAEGATADRRRDLGTAVAVREFLVCLHDLLHQFVAHDVAVVEVDERDALDRADDLHRFDEPGRAADRQIDLRDVAGDHRLRAETETCQEHLHL